MAGHAKACLEPRDSSPASFPPQGSPQQRDPRASSQEGASPFPSARGKEDWENLDGSELIFSLDKDEEEGTANLPENAAPCGDAGQSEGQFPVLFPLPSPPEAGFPTDVLFHNLPGFSPQGSGAPLHLQGSPGPKPLINLVTSLSSETEAKESCPLQPQPLLNLVKSISTEISRLEPEVTQSKSDSKLNVHLWRQITQPKSRDGDSRTAPSSPSSSPSESKGSFFKAQEAKFEDTKRRFSEAMQEPFSRLSKIMGEENSGLARYKLPHSSAHVPGSPSSHSEAGTSLDARPSHRKAESDRPGENASQAARRSQLKDGFPWEHTWGPALNGRYEICSCGDVIQVVEVEQSENSGEEAQPQQPLDELPPAQPGSPVPCKTLACLTILVYSCFILPLPPYLSGLCLGLACGFLLGFLIILLVVPTPSLAPRQGPCLQDKLRSELLMRKPREPDTLKSWMNEMYFYDPEIYHPSLTHSVFVTLEGTAMKLSYPKNNVPRRATFKEEILDVAFVSHRCYDMSNAKVFLFPPGLARKRMWNKKYPICILFPDQEFQQDQDPDQNFSSSNEHDMGLPRDESLKKTQAPGQDIPLKPPQDVQERTLYLFGRTGREKEEWFQHLMAASQEDHHGVHSARWSEGKLGFGSSPLSSPSGKSVSSNGSSRGSAEDIPSPVRPKDLAGTVRQKILLDYSTYMSRLVPPETGPSPLQSPCHGAMSSPTPPQCLSDMNGSSELSLTWMNALVGRIFWDFLREKYWADQVSNKIQKKLSKIKLPYFMNELTLTELDMGTSIPLVLGASNPIIDNRGLWVDLEVTYNGSLQMTLETKMNLCKLGKEAQAEESGQTDAGGEGAKPRAFLLADSDAESSSAGSSDEEDVLAAESSGAPGERTIPPPADSHGSGHSTSRKILRFVDKIAKSRCFQKATENEFIKKKIEEVSNMPLLLSVEVQELAGTLAVNIPPPPTDRIWYSFRIPPQLELKVHPKLGEREVTFIHVTEWIERKLQHEFQKILVMPNMDDLLIPIMHSNLEPQPPGEGPFKDFPADSEKRL